MNPRLLIVAATAIALVAAIIMHGRGKSSLPGAPTAITAGTSGGKSCPEPTATKPWKSSPVAPKPSAGASHARSTGNSKPAEPAITDRNTDHAATLPRRPRYLAGDYIEELRARRLAEATAPANSSPGSITRQAPAEYVLTPGMRLPAALIAAADDTTGGGTRNDNSTTPAATARASLESTFTAELAEALRHPDVAADPALAAKAYESARARADALYKILFGDSAFNQVGMKAAGEALHAE